MGNVGYYLIAKSGNSALDMVHVHCMEMVFVGGAKHLRTCTWNKTCPRD